jgi:hypothetical protein
MASDFGFADVDGLDEALSRIGEEVRDENPFLTSSDSSRPIEHVLLDIASVDMGEDERDDVKVS